MSDGELKPCPFCNGTAAIDSTGGKLPVWFWVKCLHCGTQSGIYKTETEAIANWNRRGSERGVNLHSGYPTLFRCSVCGEESDDTTTFDHRRINFCPHCGAEIKGENDE